MAIFIKNGAYWIGYYSDGKRHREKVGPSKALAKEALAKRLAQIAERKFFPDRDRVSIGLSQMGEEFWQLYGRFKKGASYPSMHKRVMAEFCGRRMDEITVPVVMEFLNRIREQTSVSNSNRYHTFLRSLFNRAIEWGKFDGPNPLAKIRQGREPQHRLRFLTKQEISQLLSACSPRIFPIVACALLTGMRRGEILGLTWETVDLSQGVIYLLETKSGKPRELPISPKLATILEQLRSERAAGTLFEISQDVLHADFQATIKRAGIRDFRFHDLRHTFASHFVMRTNDLPTLQKLLGHRSPAMTQRYAHLSKGHLQIGMMTFDAGMDVFREPSSLASGTSAVAVPATHQ
jgi:integrase